MSSYIQDSSISIKGCFFFFLGGLFFIYEYFTRVSIAAIDLPFRSSLHINAAAFASISAAYFLAYSIMQVPVGILTDRFGVRKIGTFAILWCAFGCFLFSISEGFYTAWIARFLIGFGSAFAFIMLLNIGLDWFPRRFFGTITGMTQILGILGPLTAGLPLALAMNVTHNDWQFIFKIIFFIGCGLAILFALCIRNKRPPKKTNHNTYKKNVPINENEMQPLSIWQTLKTLTQYKQVWLVACFAFLVYPAAELFGSLFGPSFMISRGFSALESNASVSLIWLGMGLGSPIAGLISDLLQKRKLVLGICALIGILSTTLIIWSPQLSLYSYDILFFLLGASTAAQALSFTLIIENTPNNLKSTAMAINNMMVVLGAAIIQLLGGEILQKIWSHQLTSKNIPIYSLHDYQISLSLGIIYFVAAFLVLLFCIRETHAKSVKLNKKTISLK